MAEGRRRDTWEHTAVLLSMLHNCHVDPRESKPAKFEDFYPFPIESTEREDVPDVLVLKEFFQ